MAEYKTAQHCIREFKQRSTPQHFAIFRVVQRADLFQLVYSSNQADEYLSYAEEFIEWLDGCQEPDFDQVVAKLHDLFDGMNIFDPEEAEYHKLSTELCAIIYDFDRQIA